MSVQPQLNFGVVKQVLSGHKVIVRSKSQNPQEKAIILSYISAGKLPRTKEDHDEPFAWEAREFLRKKLVGREVCFTLEKKALNASGDSSSGEFGFIYIGKDMTGENVAESLVVEGLVDVRRNANRSNEAYQRLCELEDNAKNLKKGKHGADSSLHIRSIKGEVPNPTSYVESLNQKPISAIVEHVFNGSTLKLFLLPEFYSITLELSGAFCEDKNIEAKNFTESRLLQREVEVILEGCNKTKFVGTILHPRGNIAEFLLNQGFAECVTWKLHNVTGAEKLKAAERSAKEKGLGIWKERGNIPESSTNYQAKVIEVVLADHLVVKLADGSTQKIFLSSLKSPKLTDESMKEKVKRPLYDIPHMFEAREFLRKKLIGKRVDVSVDYKQDARKEGDKEYPVKTCCTVTVGGINVAEALVSKGLAMVHKHPSNDNKRSSHYKDLQDAESKAQKSEKGIHGKDMQPHRVIDLSGEIAKAKQFFPFLQRAGRMEAVVEFVSNGSRLRLYVPRENCLIVFLLAGISCAKSSRDTANGYIKGDPYGDEALHFTKDLCLQREVEIEVETMDKAGNCIGWLFFDNSNLSVSLVREGLAEIHASAKRSPYYKALQEAENSAKYKKLKMWEHYIPTDTVVIEEETERKVDYKPIEVTEIRNDLRLYVQYHDDGLALVEMLQQLRLDFTTNIPLPGSYKPRIGDMCAALFSEDGLWYRGRVQKLDGNFAEILFIDYGNIDRTAVSNLAALPSSYQILPATAREYHLAFLCVPTDPENREDAQVALKEILFNTKLKMNVEYNVGSLQYVTFVKTDDPSHDIGKDLVENGYLMVDKKKKEKKFKKVIQDYSTAQDVAKESRLNLWRYGDITEDDAKEFG